MKLTIETDDPAELHAVLDRVAGRHQPMSGAHAVMAGDQCRRTLCGHPRANHAAESPEGRAVGVGNGWCTLCHNAAKCESFIGPGGS